MTTALSDARVTTDFANLVALRARVDETHLFSSTAQRSSLVGMHHFKLGGRGIDFDQVRAYQNGDDIRSIDWRVTARTQKTHTKLFHEERERPVFVVVEQRANLFYGTQGCFKSVIAAEAAAYFGWAALAHKDRVGGLIFSDRTLFETKPQRHKHQLLQLLNRLANTNHVLAPAITSLVQPDTFINALKRTRQVLRPGSLVILICDERSFSTETALQIGLLARHTNMVLLTVSDPIDHQLPAGNLRFCQGGQTFDIAAKDVNSRAAYQAKAQQRHAAWEKLCIKHRVLWLPLTTAQDVVGQLKASMHQYLKKSK